MGWCRREEVAGMTMRMRRRALGKGASIFEALLQCTGRDMGIQTLSNVALKMCCVSFACMISRALRPYL